MFEIAEVNFGKRRLPLALQKEIRSAMILCFNCNKEAVCKEWTEANEKGANPPDFCKLRASIARMKALI